MSQPTATIFNPFEPGFTDDPYPQYARLRAEAPAHEHPLGFWFLARYSDVQSMLKSEQSVELTNLGPGRYREMNEQLYGEVGTPRLGGLSMLDRDPPTHTRLRKLVTKAFTPRAVQSLEGAVLSLVDAQLHQIAQAGHADLVASLAFPLPFEVISRMLGMPDTDHERVRELAGVLAGSFEPGITPELAAAITEADRELAGIVREVVRWKRDHPADDLMSAMISAEDAGDVLNDDELVAQVELLYLAGYHNTVNFLANGLLALLRNPEQMARLRSEPELIDTAIDELLRYDVPAQALRRITVRPFDTGDVVIPEGAFVLLSLGSANRDDQFWGPDADQLRLDRSNARAHLSFGGGSRYCLGAALARLEGRAAINGLLRRFDDLRLDGDVSWNGRINLRGPEVVPIAV